MTLYIFQKHVLSGTKKSICMKISSGVNEKKKTFTGQCMYMLRMYPSAILDNFILINCKKVLVSYFTSLTMCFSLKLFLENLVGPFGGMVKQASYLLFLCSVDT